ncbi:hypothetical protein HYPSUDRAFT_54814 [Hypholoma sublateritium FD-334 SS-4]|uniref:Uncharacterized protein n=1 Tax=Hypholoma sublateritium (strain FD-334 SS-4) TaxID=945553 RepID=A0A0D2NVB0_HYPSF|nr:hypothetical protein HYPSUDRAFT_54814 [Hypholoma sublateritium FD-334 SS-4]
MPHSCRVYAAGAKADAMRSETSAACGFWAGGRFLEDGWTVVYAGVVLCLEADRRGCKCQVYAAGVQADATRNKTSAACGVCAGRYLGDGWARPQEGGRYTAASLRVPGQIDAGLRTSKPIAYVCALLRGASVRRSGCRSDVMRRPEARHACTGWARRVLGIAGSSAIEQNVVGFQARRQIEDGGECERKTWALAARKLQANFWVLKASAMREVHSWSNSEEAHVKLDY